MSFDARFAFMMLSFLWAGLLIGVSFLAMPAKFLAPALSLPVALDVGRQTFCGLARAEWAAAALLICAVLFMEQRVTPTAIVATVAILLLVRAIALLPVLDQRVLSILAGQAPAPSRLHWIFVSVEAAMTTLILGGAALVRRGIDGCLPNATATWFDVSREVLTPVEEQDIAVSSP